MKYVIIAYIEPSDADTIKDKLEMTMVFSDLDKAIDYAKKNCFENYKVIELGD